jgi:hypothetical protein
MMQNKKEPKIGCGNILAATNNAIFAATGLTIVAACLVYTEAGWSTFVRAAQNNLWAYAGIGTILTFLSGLVSMASNLKSL